MIKGNKGNCPMLEGISGYVRKMKYTAPTRHNAAQM
jgi:hypothetical protein